MVTIEIKCHGIYLPAFEHPIISDKEYPSFDDAINVARAEFVSDPLNKFTRGEYTAGVRFNSNREVLVRIVSACPTREFFDAHQAEWIHAGLAECAHADNWYTHEKNWE